MNTQYLELDVSKRGYGQCVTIGQGDDGGTTISADIYDNGASVDLSGFTAVFCCRLPDRTHYVRDTGPTVSGGTITYVVDESKAASVEGYTDEAYFEITDGTRTYSTERFALDIKRNATDGMSPAESWDTEVAELIERGSAAITAADAATTKATSAATAATSAATKATSAAEDATDAATDAREAAAEARGAISVDLTLYLAYDTVGDTDYLTLVDTEE